MLIYEEKAANINRSEKLRILATEIFKILNNINFNHMKYIFEPKLNSEVRPNDIMVQRYKNTKCGNESIKSSSRCQVCNIFPLVQGIY